MSRKVFFITIIILLLITVLLFILPITWKGKRASEYLPENIQRILPFGVLPENKTPISQTGKQNEQNNTPTTTNLNNGTTTTEQLTEPIVRKIYNKPIAGSLIILREREYIENKIKKKETEYFVRFVDRATGHIYETNLKTGQMKKISNTTVPEIYEAYFSKDGNYLLGRFLDDDGETIKTYGITLKDATSTTASTGTSTASTTQSIEQPKLAVITKNFEDNIKEMSLSSDKKNILYLVWNDEENQTTPSDRRGTIIQSGLSRENPKEIYSGILREWQIHSVSGGAIISSRPSDVSDGYAYLARPGSDLNRLAGPMKGLTVLPSRDQNHILVGEGGENIKMFVKNLGSGETRDLLIKTLPEKCIWARKNLNLALCAVPVSTISSNYPDYWYQGKITWNDAIWIIDSKTGIANYAIGAAEFFEPIDAVSFEIANDDSYAVFMNKKDLSLWSIKISTTTPQI